MEDDSTITKDLFDTRVMGVLTDRPSNIRKRFWDKYASSPKGLPNIFISSVRIMTISDVIVSKRISAIR